MGSIVCVVPSIRPERMAEFRKAWAPLFEKHRVTLITVWDGDSPQIEVRSFSEPGDAAHGPGKIKADVPFRGEYGDLICRRTDAVRNLGFVGVYSYGLKPDYILTLDDDVQPPAGSDPIQEHLDVLNRRVPISWMNTAMDQGSDWIAMKKGPLGIRAHGVQVPYLRGFPYGIRDEAEVMVSHGVWVNVPDFDGKTQLELTNNGKNPERLPYSLPYFRGPIPRGAFAPISGMNLMVRREALPYLYFAPMGVDTGITELCKVCEQRNAVPIGLPIRTIEPCPKCGSEYLEVGRIPTLNRFADIWMGLLLKKECDRRNWAIYTGASTVIHTRASDPHKNAEQEKLGMEWNEWAWAAMVGKCPPAASEDFRRYWTGTNGYLEKAGRFARIIESLQ